MVDISTLKTDRSGTFVFPAASRTQYEFFIPAAGDSSPFKSIARLEAVEGQDVNMGVITLQLSPGHEPVVDLAGPIQITGPASVENPKAVSAQDARASSIAAIFAVAGSGVRVIHGDGKEVRPPQEKAPDCKSMQISEDKLAVGWLLDFEFCCTSYPISLELVIYRIGKPLRRFTGDGRTIFDWHFVAGGKQVAFYQDFLHGTPSQHYELRDVESGRLVGKWDGEITSKAPVWVRGLRS
jgi:hypothetical protein